MSDRNVDPVFERTPEHKRYTGKLDELLPRLRREAFAAAGSSDGATNDWAWVCLPRGAFVGLRLWHDMRKEVRICRVDKPRTEEQRAAWQREVAVFEGKLRLMDWYRMPLHPDDDEFAAVRFAQLRPGEVAPEKGRCASCGAEVRYEAVYGERGQRCTGCAAAAGAEYTATRAAEREQAADTASELPLTGERRQTPPSAQESGR